MNNDQDDKQTTQRGRLWNDKPDTAILPSNKRRFLHHKVSPDTVTLGEQRELILVIRGMVERVLLPRDTSIVLGRTDLNARFHPDVDLTPYGALDRGVSRGHARLHMEDDKLYVTDLGSTNGTFLAGKRLAPEEPTQLRKGDELLLGRLAIQVLFRN
ncbi:MAG: FHA domain-containing protein [bacterium]|nr:FHA domain-containing protein [bacterium]